MKMKNLEANDLGKLIEKRRGELGLSRRDMMLKLLQVGVDVAERTIVRYEAGGTYPPFDVLLGIAKVLQLDLAPFFLSRIDTIRYS